MKRIILLSLLIMSLLIVFLTGCSLFCEHIDANDDEFCDQCEKAFEDGEDIHITDKSSVKQENRVEPTCTKEGSYDEVTYCKGCGEEVSRKTVTLNVIDHERSDWIVDFEATCSEKGQKHIECIHCEEVLITRSISMLGHNLIEADCTAPTTCTRCNYTEGLALGHNYTQGVCERCEDIMCKGLDYTLSNDEEYYIVSDIGTCTDTYITVPSSYKGLPVKEIGAGAFASCSFLEGVIIPDSVTQIGDQAFAFCDNLIEITVEKDNEFYTSIDGNLYSKDAKTLVQYAIGNVATTFAIPDSVTQIVNWAFAGCKNLTNISVGINNEFYTSIDGNLYTKDRKTLVAYAIGKVATEFVIPDTVTNIGAYAFYACSDLNSVTIPDSVTDISDYAFENCTSITNVTVPDSVTNIGYGAFSGCSKLVSITIPFVGATKDGTENTHFGYIFGSYTFKENSKYVPASLKTVVITGGNSIGDYVFCGCSKITSVQIPNSVTTIGKNAFYGCSTLASITIPNSVTEIGKSAFENCTSLADAVIGDNLITIGDSAFKGCSALIEITIPDSVTEIGNSAFENCTSLAEAIIGNSVITIGNSAFKGCSSLVSVTIPNSVTKVGDSAFKNCTSLAEAIIGNNVITIGNSAFKGCSVLASIIIPDSVISIGKGAFEGCSLIESITIPFVGATNDGTENTHFGYIFGADTYEDNARYVPESLKTVIITDSATIIHKNAFYGCSAIESMTLPFVGETKNGTENTHFGYIFGANTYEGNSEYVPASIKNVVITGGDSIGDYVFYGCSKITSVQIPNSVTTIGKNAFYGCSALASITIPDSVTAICDSAFENCTSLAEAIIGNSVITIGNSAFKGCSALASVIIPDSVTEIGNSAFENCTRLSDVTIGNSVITIGNSAFKGCSTLTGIIIPDSATTIGDSAFENCRRLADVTIGDSVITIGNSAFKGCSVLESIIIPDSVTEICDSAFENCTSLAEAIIGNNVITIGNSAFKGCSSLVSIIIPDSVTTIGTYAFGNCTYIANLIIGNSVTTIDNSAFYNCYRLTSVTIPDSVTEISDDAFRCCYTLVEVINHSSLDISVGSTDYGFVAYYAIEVHTGESKIVNYNDFLFYTYDNVNYLVRYVGNTPELVLPADYNGEEYVINDYAFYNSSFITEVTVPDSVTNIGYSAFSGCSSIKSITLPFVGETKDGTENTHFGYIFGAKTYEENSEYVPASLKTVVITGGNSIGNYVFYRCSKLISVQIPNTVTTIGKNAFYGCSTLASITIPDSVTEIGESAFENCTSLAEAIIGNNVITIGNSAFKGCSVLASIIIPDSVTTIGDSAFENCTSLESVTIGNSVIRIGSSAFYNCKNLTDVVVPDSVTFIGISTFSGCSKLESLTLPFVGSLKNSTSNTHFGYIFGAETYEDNAEYVPESLKNVIITDSATIINKNAFYGCSSIESITLPFVGETKDGTENTHFGYIFGAETYEDNAEYVPESLKTVIITDSATIINKNAFYGCSAIKSLTLPFVGETNNGTENTHFGYIFGADTYEENSEYVPESLKTVIITDSATIIHKNAFYGCSSIESITLPFVGETKDGTENTHFGYIFGAETYEENSEYVPASLKNVVITGGNSIGDYVFYGCSKLISVQIPNTVTTIGKNAFYGCSGLTGMTIPDSVISIDRGAFSGCSGLTEITIPDSVTSIGRWAFYGCSKLKSITLPFVGETKNGTTNTHFGYIFGASTYEDNSEYVPTSLKTVVITITDHIDDYAFYGCSKLTGVTIPDTVTVIGDAAFYGCSGLAEITIPDSVTDIGDYAFYACSSIKSVTIPGSIINMGDYLFHKCSSLKSVVIEKGVTAISNYAFYACPALTEVTIPDSVISIGNNAFRECTSLATVVIPDSVTEICHHAFYKCTSLSDLTIGNSVSIIGNSAFEDCKKLTSIAIPDSVTSIGSSAFAWCTALEDVYITDIAAWCNITFGSLSSNPLYYASNLYLDGERVSSVVIPDGVTAIPAYAFSCNSLTAITIPDSVTAIGEGAFRHCVALTNVTIPDSVTSIGNSAFYDCSNLTSVTISNNVTVIGDYTFSGCTSISNITIPDGVTEIGAYAFAGCTSLTNITIPDSVTSIGERAFEGCYNLSGITIGNNVTSIGSYAFSNCTSLTKITIPDSVTSIASYAFYGCTNLTDISIGKGVTKIGVYAFDACSGLENVYITDLTAWLNISFASYPSNPLCYADNLYLNRNLVTYIVIPDSITDIKNYAFYNYSNLSGVTISDGVLSIGDLAFYGCSGLSDVIIPDSVTGIGNYAFYGCSGITDVIIPDSVTGIGNYAFYGCSGITSVMIPDSVISIGDHAFNACSGLTTITVDTNNEFYRSIDGNLYTKDGKTLVQYAIGKADEVVVIPDGVTTIYKGAFYGCKNMTDIVISDSVTTIGALAFEACPNLKNVCYVGSEAEWQKINIEIYNTTLAKATICYDYKEE